MKYCEKRYNFFLFNILCTKCIITILHRIARVWKFDKLKVLIYNAKDTLAKGGKSMIEKLKQSIKKSFSSGPKAKIIVIGAITMTIAIATTVTMMSMRKTLVISLDGKDETFVTYKGTVKDVLQENNIVVSDKDKLQPSLNTKISKGDTIKLKQAIPIEISCGDKKIEVQSAENTVKDVLEAEEAELKNQGIEFKEGIDEVAPALDSNLSEDADIQVVKVESKEVIEQESIAFDTLVEKDSNLDKSMKKIKTQGINGQKEITYNVVYKDGVETHREVKSTKVIKEPVNQTEVQGTGNIYVSRGADVTNAGRKTLNCIATAYSGGVGTSSGRKPKRVEDGLSTIAVDPTVIPMGSKVYVNGYGYAVAADTGTAIKGNKIDLYFNTYRESCDWGLKNVKVTIVAYPGEW